MAWTLILQCLAIIAGMMVVAEILARLFLDSPENEHSGEDS